MAMFLSARLALRRAVSLGAGLCRASEDSFSRRLLHGQLLPRSFASDASPFGRNMLSPPSGSGIADMDPPQNFFDGNLRQKFNSYNFVRQDNRANAQVNFNNTDNGAAMPRIATGEKLFSLREGFPFSSSRAFTKDYEQYSKKRDFVHVLLKRKKTFVTVTDSSGNKKTGGSAGCLEDRKGRSRLSRYASEAVAEQVGRSARKMGLTSVVMKVKGASFFKKKKKKAILSFREGFGGERVRDRSPIMYIHDVTQLPHNGCRLRKQRRV